MGNYIRTSPHKKSIRAVQLLSYFTLLCLLANIVVFIAYSLKSEQSKDSYVFFATVFLYILGCALHSAVGVSLPNSGKFAYYRPSFDVFVLSAVIGIIDGIRNLAAVSKTEMGHAPSVFYLAFFIGSFIANIVMLRFFTTKKWQKGAIAAVLFQIVLIGLHIGDIFHTMYSVDTFTNSLPSKYNAIRLACNFAYLVTCISTLMLIFIIPSENSGEKGE